MKRLICACLILASCRHRVQPLMGAIAQTDAFLVACTKKQNCDGGQPRRSFTTSKPPTSEVTVTRNGLVLYAGPDNYDYSVAAHEGLVNITMTSQQVIDGDLILLRYLTSAAADRR